MFNLKLYEHEKQISRMGIPILLFTVFFSVLTLFINTPPFLFFLWVVIVLLFLAIRLSTQQMKNYTTEVIKNNSFFLFLLSSEKSIYCIAFVFIIYPAMLIVFRLFSGVVLESIIAFIVVYCLFRLFDFFDICKRVASHFQLKIKED